MSNEFDLINRLLNDRVPLDQLSALLGSLRGAPGETNSDNLAPVLQKLNAILVVSHEVADCLSLDELLPQMMDIVTDTLGADRSTLFLHDPATDGLYSRIAQGDAMSEIRIPHDRGIAGAVFTSATSEIIPDAYTDARFNQNVDKQTGYRTRNILCAPIVTRDKDIIGVTQVLNKIDGAFTPEDQALLEAINTQASSALLNAQLFERVQVARKEESQLLALTTAISSELQLKPLLQKIMGLASGMLDADRSTLFLHDPKTDQLWSQVAEGLEIKEIRFPASIGIAGSVFSTGETVNIPDAYADARFNQDIDRQTGYRTHTILCMPVITRQGNRVGVLQLLNKHEGPFNGSDERRLSAFCAQASIAIENASLFDAVLEMRNYNESILQSLSNGVFSLDSTHVITKVNAAAAGILGVDTDALEAQPMSAIFSGPNTWVMESVLKVHQTGEPEYALDQELALPGQQIVSVNLNSVPLMSVKNEPAGTLLVLEDITTEKRVMGTLARYMSKEVADRLMSAGEDRLGGTIQTATVLFSDIRSFTSISERIGAQETVNMLNGYFSIMVEILFRHGGILDKYIGDAIMAVFGAPFSSPLDADNAVRASIDMLRALEDFNQHQQAHDKEVIAIGIGLNSDEILSGNIGSAKRMDYTVIGDGVNLASRLEGANKLYGTQALLSECTIGHLQEDYLLREVDLIRVQGKERPVAVHEVLDHLDPDRYPGLQDGLEHFQTGLSTYRARDWRGAAREFERALAARANDRVSQLYLDRCRHFQEQPPGADWDGVWVMTSK